MKAHAMTTYKLIILFMLHNLDFPMTNGQLSEFILEKGYTDYFTLQQSLYDLSASKMIKDEKSGTKTKYSITDYGEEAINMFSYKIPSMIKEDIFHFFEEKKYQLRREIEINANFYPSNKDEYTVECKVQEKDTTLLQLNLNVVSIQEASYICQHWNENCDAVYSYLVKKLLFGYDEKDKEKEGPSTK